MSVYAAFFLGQGGYVFSLGVPLLACRAQNLDIETDVYGYTEIDRAVTNLRAKHAAGRNLALIGYSLGCTTATAIQETMPVDLVCCLAESSLGENHPIVKANTKRSVLFMGPDFLSDAGKTDGFDRIVQTDAIHLWIDFDSTVTDGVLAELAKLQKE